ncbi:hypothetical protein MTO96_004704 [Rhipicephalus appendiculatus]
MSQHRASGASNTRGETCLSVCSRERSKSSGWCRSAFDSVRTPLLIKSRSLIVLAKRALSCIRLEGRRTLSAERNDVEATADNRPHHALEPREALRAGSLLLRLYGVLEGAKC